MLRDSDDDDDLKPAYGCALACLMMSLVIALVVAFLFWLGVGLW
jgi:hypothetical protein